MTFLGSRSLESIPPLFSLDRGKREREGGSIFGSSLTRNGEDYSIWGGDTWRRRRRPDVGRRRRQAWYMASDLDPRPRLPLVRSLVDMCRSSSPSIHTPANPTLPCPTCPAPTSIFFARCDATSLFRPTRTFLSLHPSSLPRLTPCPSHFFYHHRHPSPLPSLLTYLLIYYLTSIRRMNSLSFPPNPLPVIVLINRIVCPFFRRNKRGKGRTRLSTARKQHRLVSNLVVDVHVHDDDAVPTLNVFGARVVSISPKPSQATATFHRPNFEKRWWCSSPS